MSAISSFGAECAGFQMQVARPRRGRRGDAALRVAGGGKAQFARGPAIEQPGAQEAVLDQSEFSAGDAFAVERMRTQRALAQRVVDDADAVGEQLLAQLVAQETGLARDRGAVGGAGKVRNQRARHTRIEHHRHLAGRNFTRVEPFHRALAGGAPDFLRALQIGGVQHARIIVIALHAGAFAGDRGHRQAVARAEIGPAEAVTGHQHHAADAGRSRGAARFGDALDRERRPLRRRARFASSCATVGRS